MKKCILMIAVLALSVLSMVSCKKDKVDEGEAEKTIIYATMDGPKSGGEKTHLGSTSNSNGITPTLWSKGDQVVISNEDHYAYFTLLSGEDTERGTFTSPAALNTTTNHVALYPSSMRNISFSNNSVTFDLPAFQYYSEPIGGVPTFAEGTCPMVAVGQYSVSDGAWNFEFKNLTGVLKLNLTGTGKVGKIVLKDNDDNMTLWGTATATVSANADPTMTVTAKDVTSCSNELTLLCPEGVKLSQNPTSFYFVLPVGALNDGFTVEIYNDTYCLDQTIDFSHVTGHPIQRSMINNMSWTLDKTVVSTGYLPGEFNVGNGKMVHFSKGNVYKSGEIWYFEKNQYDFRTWSGLQACIAGDGMATTPNDDMGLFCWSHRNNNYGVDYLVGDGDLEFNDWGDLFDDQYSTQYSTLGRVEFMNLFSTTLNGNYDLDAIVGDVHGAIILPRESDFVSYGLVFGSVYGYREWAQMEACGAVFLPYCGRVQWKNPYGPYYAIFVNNPYEAGYYWTSSVIGNSYVFLINQNGNNNFALDYNNGCSVRLVTEVQ